MIFVSYRQIFFLQRTGDKMKSITPEIVETFNNTLIQQGITIVSAESMTGGLFASTITSANGAMKVLQGGIVAYDTDVKTQILGVPKEIIDRHTAESQETTDAMCQGLRKLYPQADLFIAITGVAEESPLNDVPEGKVYLSMFYRETGYRYDTILVPQDESDPRNAIRIQAVRLMMDQILYIVTRPPVAGMVAPET